MRLVRYNPSLDVFRQVDRLFEDFNRTVANLDTARPFAAPALDIVDNDDHMQIHVDLPGYAPEDVNIEFQNGSLVISAETKHEETVEEKNYTRRERYHGAYKRALRIPDTFDIENAEANFENGVLLLTLPKKPEAQPVRIAIGGAAEKALKSGK